VLPDLLQVSTEQLALPSLAVANCLIFAAMITVFFCKLRRLNRGKFFLQLLPTRQHLPAR